MITNLDNIMDQPRDQLVVLWVVGTMDELRSRGELEGGHRLTGVGQAKYDRLVEIGFSPTDEEVDCAVASLRKDSPIELHPTPGGEIPDIQR